MAYQLIGSGTTNSQGVAVMNKDANGNPLTHSYTGVGAGELDLIASLDNPIQTSSLVSENHPVQDCFFTYLQGTITSVPSNLYSNNVSVSVEDGYLVAEQTSSTTSTVYFGFQVDSLPSAIKGARIRVDRTFEQDDRYFLQRVYQKTESSTSWTRLTNVSGVDYMAYDIDPTATALYFRFDTNKIDGQGNTIKTKDWRVYPI